MRATFKELPSFERHRAEYFDDSAYLELQRVLLANPEAGDLIKDTGGLRKLRRPDPRRGKGTRGGLRVIYFGGTAKTSSGSSLFTTKTKPGT
jgi:hypothetical protein